MDLIFFPLPSRVAPTALVLLSLIIGAAGCERKGSSGREREPHRVVATIYPLADIARVVGGKRVEVSWLIERGQSLTEMPHDAASRVNTANVIVGRGTVDQWALGGEVDTYRPTEIIRLDGLESAKNAHGYVWLDPAVANETANAISVCLTDKEGEYEAYYRDNAQMFASQVDALVKEFEPRLRESKNRRFLSTDPNFAPLARSMGLEIIEVIRAPTTKLSDRQIADLRNAAQQHGISTLFISADQPAAVQRDLADQTGLKVLTLDPLGTSAPSGGRSTYLQLMRYNLEQLTRGLSR